MKENARSYPRAPEADEIPEPQAPPYDVSPEEEARVRAIIKANLKQQIITAVEAFRQGKVTVSRAAEMTSLSYGEMEAILATKGLLGTKLNGAQLGVGSPQGRPSPPPGKPKA